MVESLTNKHISDTFNRYISENFKPVEYIKIEDDITTDTVYANEYTVWYYAHIQKKDKDIYEKKRPVLDVFIRFKDNTGFKMNLRPEDYLSNIKQTNFNINDKIKYGLDVTNHITSYERSYDLKKMINTILSTLKGEKQYNPTFETLDFIK